MPRKQSKIPKSVRDSYVPLLKNQQRKLKTERESRIVTATAKKVTKVFEILKDIFKKIKGDNLISPILSGLDNNQSPDYYMHKVLSALDRNRTEETMEIGSIYVFIYKAKTPKKWYDEHPVTVIVGKYKWGYRGYNYHWERSGGYIESPIRNYKFGRFYSRYYKIKPQELEDILKIPFFKPIYNHR